MFLCLKKAKKRGKHTVYCQNVTLTDSNPQPVTTQNDTERHKYRAKARILTFFHYLRKHRTEESKMIENIKSLYHKFVNLDNDKEIDKNRNLWAIVKLCTSFGKLQQSSAALTYHTLFAIVPVMALMVAIAKILGYGEIFKEQVQAFFHGQDLISENLLGFADSYLNNTQVSFWLGAGIGLILLLYSVFSIFRTIDATFNALWNMPGRDFAKLLGIFAIVLLIPFVVIILLAIWWTMSSYLKGSIIHEVNVFIFTVSAYVVCLFGAYKLIPQAKVKTKYAAIAALVCGSVFALMQYFSYAIISMFGNYRNIYGDLATLIIFLLLIYFSWTICMAGSRWNYFLQRADKLVRENKFTGISNNYQKFLCLMILCKAEQLCTLKNKDTFDIKYLSEIIECAFDIPPHVSSIFLKSMCDRGIFLAADENNIYRIAPEYRKASIINLVKKFDAAGNNKEAIEEAQEAHEHKNAQLLWEFINNEKHINEKELDIPLELLFFSDINAEQPTAAPAEKRGFFDRFTELFK